MTTPMAPYAAVDDRIYASTCHYLFRPTSEATRQHGLACMTVHIQMPYGNLHTRQKMYHNPQPVAACGAGNHEEQVFLACNMGCCHMAACLPWLSYDLSGCEEIQRCHLSRVMDMNINQYLGGRPCVLQ